MTWGERIGWGLTVLVALGLIIALFGQSADLGRLNETVAKYDAHLEALAAALHQRVDDLIADLNPGVFTITDVAPETRPVPIVTPALGENTQDQAKVLINHWARTDSNEIHTRELPLGDGTTRTFQFRDPV